MPVVTSARMHHPDVLADVPDPWQLTLQQPPDGYRFSLDAFLLADFVPAAARPPMIDLGTGCGVVALLLARRFSCARIISVELQTELVRSARQNAVHNSLQHQVDVIQADVRTLSSLFLRETFSTVVCNPPYRRVGQGRLNPHASKAMARHEVTLTLSQLLDAARWAVHQRGLLVTRGWRNCAWS